MNALRRTASRQAMGPLHNWASVAVIAILLAAFLYTAWQKQAAERPRSDSSVPRQSRVESAPFDPDVTHDDPAPQADTSPIAHDGSRKEGTRTRIANQTIRNEARKVVFRGEVDVGPTLDRIARGERLHFPHDGTTFHNRERQLPRQPAGYYKEYVHPTPGLGGPGPQRIVTGERGEIYYTPDHYRTFERLNGR